MKKVIVLFLIAAASGIFCPAGLWAQGSLAPLTLTSNDRVLVLAPHPDDETIGAGGIIQEAVVQKIPIKVVYLTNGDNNELSFLVFEKRPILSRKGLLKMGELRRQEAIAAMESLGLTKDQLAFLGYPDFGTLNIFTQRWNFTRPYKGLLTRVQHVPYSDSLSPGSAFTGESVLRDIKKIIRDFKPTKIFVTHPADTNSDHQAAFLFMNVALWDLQGQFPTPEVHPFVVHVPKWPVPRGFHPDAPLTPPAKLANDKDFWRSFSLTEEQVAGKERAIKEYKSQNAYNPWYLFSFARQNELFGDYPEITLKDSQEDTIQWNTLGQIQNIEGQVIDEENVGKRYLRAIAYAHNDRNLYVHIESRVLANELLIFNVYLLGYKEGTPFAEMPKIRLNIKWGKKAVVYDNRSPIFVREVEVRQSGNTITAKIPLVVLDNPGRVFACVQATLTRLPLESTPWRILHLE